LTKAVKDYWKWYYAYSNLEANENAYKAAIEIYEFTLQSYKAGDASLMDTLEAKSLVNTWQTEYYISQAEAINAKFIVSNWLWSMDEKPIVLKPFVQPSPDIPEYSNSSTLSDDHPLLRYNNQKEEQFQLKRKLSAEYLKPKIAIGGAYLLAGNVSSPPNLTMFNSENRIIKAQLGIPLFLREGRGYNESQRLQLENYRWERSSMENEWRNAMESVAGQFFYLESAVSAGISNQKTLERLLQAEQRKLELGDSELIKVNLRTGYYAKAMIQRAKLEFELGQTWAYWMQLSNGY
jgi:outer membrane protein TolC